MSTRHLDPLDRWLAHVDDALRTVFVRPGATTRANPAASITGQPLSDRERDLSIRLLRVDHSGEVCAQALYQGQALTARNPRTQAQLEDAANEENDHLAWCRDRIEELGGRTSVLNPLFYLGSFAIGAAAGLAGDRISLGFLAETERQVVRHLDGHLQRLPENDTRSRAIIETMRDDEGRHASGAMRAGGAELPAAVRQAMRGASRVMTGTTYWV